MKKITWACSLFILFFLLLSNSYAQKVSRIYLKNGNVIKGRIIETVPETSIKVKLVGGSIISYQLSDVSKIESIPFCNVGSIGIGLGINYGGILGINGEFNIGSNVSLTGGVGLLGQGEEPIGEGYNLGLRYYLKDIGNTWRPRISACYGAIGSIEVWVIYGEDIEEIHNGFVLSIGQQWMWGEKKRHGLDLDIMFIVTSSIYDRINEIKDELGLELESPGRIKLSLGYRFAF